MTLWRRIAAAAALGVACLAGGCKSPGGAQGGPGAEPLGTPPNYRELAQRQNARVGDIRGYYTRGSVEVSWIDEHGQRQSEVGEGNLIFMRPDQVALTFEKVGKTYLWIGGGPDRSWMLWGGDISRAYIARNRNAFSACCEAFPVSLLPAELIDLYGVFELPLDVPEGVSPAVEGDEQRRAWVVTAPARWCSRRVWLAADDGRPMRVELFDAATGRLWAASELTEYREMEVRGVAPGRQPFVPTRVEVRSGELAEEEFVRLTLRDPADVPAGHTEIKPALFDFDAIRRSMRPDEVIVLDANCPEPALPAPSAGSN